MHCNGNYRSGLLDSGSLEPWLAYGKFEAGRKGVGGHSALSVGEHTGPVAHKAAVIFYNVTRQNPRQEGGARRLVSDQSMFSRAKNWPHPAPAPIDRPQIMKLLWDQATGRLLSSDWPRISFEFGIS